jgi:hypothetical protein
LPARSLARWIPWCVLALGLAARLQLGATAQRGGRHLAPDSEGYLLLADNLAHGRGFTGSRTSSWAPYSFRTPGYPTFIAVFSRLVPDGDPARLVVVAQAGLLVVTVAPLLWAARRLGIDIRGQTLLAGVLAFDPLSVSLSTLVLSETLFVCGLALKLALLVGVLLRPARRGLFACGFLNGLLTLVRPIGAYIWIVDVILTNGVLGRSWRHRALAAALLLGGQATLIVPWWTRNVLVTDTWAVTSMVKTQDVFYNAAVIESRARRVPIETVWGEYKRRGATTVSILDVVRRYPAAAVEASVASAAVCFLHPAHQMLLTALGVEGTGLFSGGKSLADAWLPLRAHPVPALIGAACLLWYVVLYALAMCGSRAAWRDPTLRRALLAPCALTIGYFALMSLHVVLVEGPRFRAPMLPELALLAAAFGGARDAARSNA